MQKLERTEDQEAFRPCEHHATEIPRFEKQQTAPPRTVPRTLQNNSYCPTDGLLESLRLYRLRTEARFSFPLGKATSPAAVPLRPLRPETACSTSLITSKITAAVVKVTEMGLATGPAFSRHVHPVRGFRGLKNAGSRIPYIK